MNQRVVKAVKSLIKVIYHLLHVVNLLLHRRTRVLRHAQDARHHQPLLRPEGRTIPPHSNPRPTQGKVGPWKAGVETHVPLWLALQLKASEKCKIYVPFWFDEELLSKISREEKAAKNELTNLQTNEFFEISYVFLSKAADNVKNIHHIRAMVEGIENMRREKIRRLVEDSHGSIRLRYLTSYEANRIKEPLSRLEGLVDRLRRSDSEGHKRQ